MPIVLCMDHDELMTKAQRIVRAQVRRAGLDRDVVDDLTQELLVKYLQAWPGTDEPDNPAAWLQHAAGNVVIDRVRTNKRKPADNYGQGGDDPVALLVATLRAAGPTSLPVVNDGVWQAALGLIPPADADILRDRFMGGTSAAELADELGISRAAVDQRVARAKARIREALAERPDLVEALQSAHQHAYLSDNRFR